ncbi:hypothetical protein PROFUN_16419 [Planoprotostelium fungivorum]|uniref:Uncharacterized protein n=1 Tax=Planoprotostelium fungivorum TaxID=1890364 RepID=A0A2P6MPV8_9EUKA|nr:hypothetical protein PROFUN_16419 [Planoprotostelium fungivorum]
MLFMLEEMEHLISDIYIIEESLRRELPVDKSEDNMKAQGEDIPDVLKKQLAHLHRRDGTARGTRPLVFVEGNWVTNNNQMSTSETRIFPRKVRWYITEKTDNSKEYLSDSISLFLSSQLWGLEINSRNLASCHLVLLCGGQYIFIE